MLRRKNVDVNENKYAVMVIALRFNKINFEEHLYGSRRTLIVNKKPRASVIGNYSLSLGNLSNNKFIAFLGVFSRHLYDRINKNRGILGMTIKFQGASKKRNIKKWDEIPVGDFFYNIDLISAYWQILLRLGYIDNKMYSKYDSDDYKQVKRYCVSFLGRSNKKVYHDENGNITTIECDITPLKNIYNNVRYELYNCIAKVVSLCNDCIEYNIDGITVSGKDVDIIKEGFRKLNLNYSITMCIKINDNEYTKNGDIRQFSRKLKSYTHEQ